MSSVKKCRDCFLDLPLANFYAQKDGIFGKMASCKKCHGIRVAKYRLKRRSTAEGWAKQVIPMLRNRARRRGTICEINAKDLIVPEVCPILLEPFVFGNGSHPLAPSVDRRIPEFGYVKGNVFVISQRANRMKSDCIDASAFRRLADWMDNTNCG